MDHIRNYRETFIRYFTDNKLFASSLYFTPQPIEEFPTDEEMATIQDENARNERLNKHSGLYPYLDTSSVPQYIPKPISLSGALGEALGRLAILMGLIVLLMVGMIISFMKYDVR